MAHVVESKIVYFGYNSCKYTYILEKEEEQQRLKLAKMGWDINFAFFSYTSSSRVHKKEIYSFSHDNYKKVYRFSLESGNWNRVFPSWSIFT